ncbi:hypothetical protein [Clostridium estertheticum]|nr:hypothetical protein [Clostridium estertheticum]MCB2343098.1 hypothetical protein [Clostridium estertheticum]
MFAYCIGHKIITFNCQYIPKQNALNTIDKKEAAVLASSPSMGENKIK